MVHNVFNLWQAYKNNATAMGVSPKDAYWSYNLASGIPVIGDFLRASDSSNAMADYMRNRGLDWNDIKYPTRTLGNGVSGYTSGILSISRNISRLY